MKLEPVNVSDGTARNVVQVGTVGEPLDLPLLTLLPGVPLLVQLREYTREIAIQNNSGATLYRAYIAPVSTSSFAILNGATLFDTVRANSVWLLSLAGATVNGASGTVVLETYA